MKKLFFLSAFLFVLSISSSIAAPQSPDLCYSASGLNITVDWTSIPEATGYTLYYAPFPYKGAHTIGSINMGTQTSASYYLWEDANYYIAVTSRNAFGESSYSNIEQFKLTSSVNSESVVKCQDSALEGTWYLNTVETNWGQWSSELPEYVGSYIDLSESTYHLVLIRNGAIDEDNSASYTVSQNTINISGYGELTYVLSEGGTRLTIYHSDGDIEVWDKDDGLQDTNYNLVGKYLYTGYLGDMSYASITQITSGRYRIDSHMTNPHVFEGEYEIQGDQLVMVTPDSPNYTGFVFQIIDEHNLTLITTGYQGSTLRRVIEH